MKQLLKRLIGRGAWDRVKFTRDAGRRAVIRAGNAAFGTRFINIGAGQDAERTGWWTGDVQTGFVFDARTMLPMKDGTVEFAYSSMFFEHIDDETAANLLREIKRVLRPGAWLRLVVPDFHLYIRKYRSGDRAFFYSDSNPNFRTWSRLGVPVDMEHLLMSAISSIQNLPVELVPYPFLEDAAASPPRLSYPHHDRIPGYYCGPAPELTTGEIQSRISSLTEDDFLSWAFEATSASKNQDPTFNSWHKNNWTEEKFARFAKDAGFSRCESSRYLDARFPIDEKLEKPQHEKLGLYFNLQA